MRGSCPISILIPTKNEEHNLEPCLRSVDGWADEIVVVDSQSTDATAEIAANHGATVVQFYYRGGWPKKRQWALDTLAFRNDWILLLDADEILPPEIKLEIQEAIEGDQYHGYWLRFEIVFLGRMLRYGGNTLWKLSLFRKGMGRFEKRLEDQDGSMADMEVHEHVIVDGRTARLKNPVRHENINTLDRYIQKHNEYSNWEAKLYFQGTAGELTPSLFGTQAQRRRFLKQKLAFLPGSALFFFVLKYIFQLGFLDGRPGFYYCTFKAIQRFYVRAKVNEIGMRREEPTEE